MTESFRALCSDFYVNQKLSVKLELPRGRETVLDMCERIRRQFPSMEPLHEREDIAPRSATEAMKDLLARHHAHARAMVVVERTKPHELPPLGLEGEAVADHVDDVRRVPHPVSIIAHRHRRPWPPSEPSPPIRS